MENKYYLRIENDNFGFVVDDIHQIRETDILITNEDYDKFFELQSLGKQFKLKEVPTGLSLFDYIEEYIPEAIKESQEPGVDECMLDLEYRVSLIELGV